MGSREYKCDVPYTCEAKGVIGQWEIRECKAKE